MGPPLSGTSTAQQSHRCYRQQVGPHRLGRSVQGPRLSTSAAAAGGSLMAVEKTLRLESTKRFPLFHRHDDESLRWLFHQGLLRREGDERTVQRRVGKPAGVNASLVTERFIRTDTRGSSSSARRAILH